MASILALPVRTSHSSIACARGPHHRVPVVALQNELLARRVFSSSPPSGLPPAWHLMAPEQADAIHGIAVLFYETFPALHLADVLGLTAIMVGHALEGTRIARSQRVDTACFTRCEGLGVVWVLSVEHRAARVAGILPWLTYSAEVIQQQIARWSHRWTRDYETIVDRGHLALEDARERQLFLFADWHAGQRVQAIESLVRSLRWAKSSAHRSIAGPQLQAEDLDTPHLLADARLLISDPALLRRSLMVDQEGRLAIGASQARDHYAAQGERPLRAVPARKLAPAPESADPAAELEGAEVLDLLRVHRERRLAQHPEGSAGALVLKHMVELADGELTLTELSRVHGLPMATLSETYRRERERLASALRRAGAA